MNLLEIIKKKELKTLNLKINLNFNTGDIITVITKITNLKKKRTQSFTGIVISKKNKSLNSSFIIRKLKNNIGVENTFQTYSPFIKKIKIKFKRKLKKSKLFFLRKKK